MLKYFLVTLFILNAAFAAKLNLDTRRKKILTIVDQELAEVSRLANQQNYKVPDTLLRISELNLEKARLYREVENEQYLAIPLEQRKRVNKNQYFEKSSEYFQTANKAAESVVKRFPSYSNIGDVYYILAYNYKELGNDKLAQKYFALASGKSKDPKILVKSKVALADYYYNDNKFKEAIPLYESTIYKSDEKWWTKDAFNLAWSYYRVKNYDKAITLMREVHKKSGGKYIDMRPQVERDIGIFYVDANRINDAIAFYESMGINYTEQFIKISNAIVSQGRFEQAEKLLVKIETIEKDQTKKNEILLAELNLFDKYNKNVEHLKVSSLLVENHLKKPLSKDQYNKLSFHINKKAAELQKAVASDFYKSVPKVRKQKANEAMAYFSLAGKLSPEELAEKIFYQAETAYSINQFGKAIGLYVLAFDESKKSNKPKIQNQSLEGMLSSLGQPTLSKKTANDSYIPVYERYLSTESSSERAKSIFVKLFNAQYEKKDIASAEKTMASFSKNFPKDFSTHEAMLAKIMDHYREKKDYGTVKSYVNKINSGEIKVSKKYADALRSLMTKIQIEGVQQSLVKGEKGVALKGYHQIYQSPESTPAAKTNAAYNLAALYYELGDANQSYQWSTIAIRDMSVGDVTKFTDSFLSIAAGLFLRQNFTQSADISHQMLAKLCSENSSNKAVAYKNAVFISLANKDLNKAIEVKNSGKRCSVSDNVISEVSFEIIKDLSKERRWAEYESTLKDLETNSKNYPLLIAPYEKLRMEFSGIGNLEEARTIYEKQNRFYQTSKAQKLDIPVEALDLIAERMMVSVLDKKQKLEQVNLSFPEATFNNAVKTKLQILDQMTNDVNAIQKIGSGKGIVRAYKEVIESYEAFGNALKEFTPPDKTPEYIASFKKAMADVHNPILLNAKRQRSEVTKLIKDNKILSDYNYSVLFMNDDSFKRFISLKEAILMEREGRR